MKVKTKKRGKTALIVIGCVIGVLIVAIGVCALVSFIGLKSNQNFIETLEPVKYENQLVPSFDEDGNYAFTTDGDFRVMQLTDVHIGGGFMSIKKDSLAINAVAAMVAEEKPDLVVVSGDVTFGVPFMAGTFNNKLSAQLFAGLMERLGVYWCPVFGNHDSEAHNYYSRDEIGALYAGNEYPHCLFQAGPDDIYGCGNYIVNVKNSAGKIVQSLFMIDSNDYINGSVMDSLTWKYDCIHEDQINWYKDQVKLLTERNGGTVPKSLAFFHIPLVEYRDAWKEYADNGFKDTENVKYYDGKVGEPDSAIFCSEINSGFFDAVLQAGSTQGIFCGHDHLNNFSLDYKGVRLTYGYSIDYLAYAGIAKFGAQRGCTMITVSPDGGFSPVHENYYQEKYVPAREKEAVTMEDYAS